VKPRPQSFLAVVWLAALAACATPPAGDISRPGSSTDGDAARPQIMAVLDTTAAGWNRGDLSAYLSAYTPGATEMLATGPAGGVEAIERTMREGFWRTGRPLQQLRYEQVNVRMLGRDNALVTGKYVLTGGERPERTGWFTTVWTRTPQGWRMIHDHS
jgi:uncharacterized protein (TIGR02246 family)